MADEKVTEQQAGAALAELLDANRVHDEDAALTPAAEATAEAEPTAGAEAAPQGAETPPEEPPDYKTRFEQLEAQAKAEREEAQARIAAQQQRFAENERILRDRHVRKSDAAQKALTILRASRSEQGASPSDVDRAIADLEATMNPASPSYRQPETFPAPQQEDQAITLNNFLNEKGMTLKEADEFGNWIRTQAATAMSEAEQEVAKQSLDGFLRLAHNSWQHGLQEKEKQTKRDVAVDAVRSVQRTQREAARAASAVPAAPIKQPKAPPNQIDVAKLTPKDVSALLRQSVEQYR